MRLLGKLVLPALLMVAGGLLGPAAIAHKPVTSKYTYNEHVFPIVRDRCGACHVDGGIAPMSLLTFNDARPWAESIREELIADRMPPWYADTANGAPAIVGRTEHALTAAQLDTLIVWATGGTPEGDPSTRPTAVHIKSGWPAGTPNLLLPMPVTTLPTDRQEDTREFLLQTRLREVRWVTAVDLLPGTPSIVHDASITVERGPTLAAWIPGDQPVMLPSGTAFRLDPGAELRVRIHYKKSWRDQRLALSDSSRVGLYFAEPSQAAIREVRSIAMEAPAASLSDGTLRFTHDVPAPLRVLAIRPQVIRPYGAIQIEARTPSGTRLPLVRLRAARPEWPIRYWLRTPIDIPAGSKIEISVSQPTLENEPRAAASGRERFAVALDVTSP